MKTAKTVCIWTVLLVTLFALSRVGYADTLMDKLAKELRPDTFQDVSKIPERPHFLLGLAQPTTRWEQFQEIRKMYKTAGVLYEPRGSAGIIDRSAPDSRADTTLQETVTIGGKKVQIIYLGYHRLPDGMTVLWHQLGEKNLAEYSPAYEKYKVRWALGAVPDAEWSAIKKALGWAQFEAVKSRIHEVIVRAAERNVAFYRKIDFLRKVVEKRQQALDDASYGNNPDVPVTEDLRMRDLMPVPEVDLPSFLPDVFFVGLGKFGGGVTYWKLPETEKIVYVSLQSLMHEYILGKDTVTAHELTHANSFLQNTIATLYFDIEVWADLATGLLDADPIQFLFHEYSIHWRDLVKIYFGYDTKEVTRRIFPNRLDTIGVVDISRKEFEENAAKIDTLVEELNKFVEIFLVDFYGDSLFWSAVNTKFCDNAAALRISFALRYEPAGLFDLSKKDKEGKVIPPAIQTKEWLMKEEEAGRIARLADYAMAETGKKVTVEDKLSKVADRLNIKCPVDSKFFLLEPEERKKALAWGEDLLKQAEAGDGISRVILKRAFGDTGFLQSLLLKQSGKEVSR